MLPDMLDTFLPTPDTKALLLALLRAHAHNTARNTVTNEVSFSFGVDVTRAHGAVAWLESVPTRTS